MHNIATIYRFNTPFLDIDSEKSSLISVKNKIHTFLIDEWLNPELQTHSNEEYTWIVFDIDSIAKIQFQYINKFQKIYSTPIFKMDVYLQSEYILNTDGYKKTTLFLTSLFENFDGLNEKEYLLEIDKSIYYKKGILQTKIYPCFDFSDIDVIQQTFESQNWGVLLEKFITTFQNKSFVLNQTTAPMYHKIHSVILYYIYLVYVMHQSMVKAQRALDDLDKECPYWEDAQITFSKKRLEFVQQTSQLQFQQYTQRLEVFFGLFE